MVVIILATLLLTAQRTLRYLQFFQQQGYERKRFLAWVWEHNVVELRGSVITLIFACVAMTGLPATAVGLSYIKAISTLLLWEGNPTRQGKLPLQMTARAIRIVCVSLVLSGAGAIAIATMTECWVYLLLQIIALQLLPGILVVATILLDPDEKRRQKWFVNDAKKRLESVSPVIIGITGSYGKTSTKDALARILDITMAPTFWPEKGINAIMGITREIRGKLLPGHQYGVIEMGAYQVGSIKHLCDFSPPQAGIITAVGPMHLERFGSIENIYRAKRELAEAIPQSGILVCNGDNSFTRRIATECRKDTTLLYGLHGGEPLDTHLSDWSIVDGKSHFLIRWQGRTYSGTTPLIGATALLNAAGAFTMACALGADPEYVLAVIANLVPIDQRLQIERSGGITYLKNGYSSNPVGFRSALEVMTKMPATRRFVMTPGIIELGATQGQENSDAAAAAAKVCDTMIVVGSTNVDALVQGCLSGGLSRQRVITCATRDEAFAFFKNIQQEGDMLLIESDLPDLYEGVHKL